MAGFFLMRVIGGLDTTLRKWSSTLSLWVRLVISRLDLVFALPLWDILVFLF